jgi:hypothetical protein
MRKRRTIRKIKNKVCKEGEGEKRAVESAGK